MPNFLVNILKKGFYLILLTPLLYQARVAYPLLTVRTAAFQILVELMSAVYLSLIIFEPKFRPRLTLLFISFTAFFTIIFLSGWWGVDWRVSLWSFPERMIGSFALLHFWALFVILVGLSREINWRHLLLFSFAVSVVAALSVFWLGGISRPGGVLGNPNFLSAYLLMNFFLGLYLFIKDSILPTLNLRDDRRKSLVWLWLIGAGLVLQLVAMMLAQTRGVFLGLLAGLFWAGGQWLWPSRTRLWQKKKIWVATLTLFVLAAGGGFWLTKEASWWRAVPVLARFADKELWQSASPRLNAWEVGWRGMRERPLLGWGWENFDKVVNKYYEPTRWRQSGGELFFSKPHNILIEYGVSGGLALITAFLIFWGTAFYKTKNPFLRGGLLAYLIPNLVSLDSFGTYLMLVLLLALIDREMIDGEVSNKVKWPFLLIALTAAMIPIYFVNLRGPYQDFEIRDRVANLKRGDENFEADLAQLEEVIKRRPQDYFMRLAYAEATPRFLSINSHLMEKTEAQLQEAIKISPRRQQAYYAWAKLKTVAGDIKGVIEAMEKAVALNPKEANSHFLYGIFLLQLNDIEKGRAELALAKEMGRGPLTPEEAKLIAGYYGDAEFYKEAIGYYRRALIYDPQDWEALWKLAVVYYYNNDRYHAKLFFNDLSARHPSFKETADFKQIEPILKQL